MIRVVTTAASMPMAAWVPLAYGSHGTSLI